MSEPVPKPSVTDPPPQRAKQESASAPWPTGGSLGHRLFQSKLLADATIVCGDGKEIAVHCPYLLSSDFFEAQTKRFVFENSASLPHLNRNHDVMNRMLEFMYCGSYAKDVEDEAVEKTMRLHIDLCVLADYYVVEGLKDYTIERVSIVLDDWEKVNLGLPEIIAAAYSKPEPTVSGIRGQITDIVAKQFDHLESDKAFCDFLEDFGECCVDVMRKINKKRPKVTGGIRTRCHHCKAKFLVELVDDHTPAHCTHCGESNFNHALRYRAL